MQAKAAHQACTPASAVLTSPSPIFRVPTWRSEGMQGVACQTSAGSLKCWFKREISSSYGRNSACLSFGSSSYSREHQSRPCRSNGTTAHAAAACLTESLQAPVTADAQAASAKEQEWQSRQARYARQAGPQTQQPGRTTPELLAARAQRTLQCQVLTNQLRFCGSWQELQTLFLEHRPRMNHIHLSALMARLAQLVNETSCGSSSGSDSRHISSTTTSSAGGLAGSGRAGLGSQKVGDQERRSEARLQLLVQIRPFLAQLVPHVGMQLLTFGPRQLSTVMWALGRLGYTPGPAWVTEWCGCTARKLALYTPQDLAMSAWGLAASGSVRLKYPTGAPLLMVQMARACARPSTPLNCKLQDVSNVMWALATAGLAPEADTLYALVQHAYQLLLRGSKLQAHTLASVLADAGTATISSEQTGSSSRGHSSSSSSSSSSLNGQGRGSQESGAEKGEHEGTIGVQWEIAAISPSAAAPPPSSAAAAAAQPPPPSLAAAAAATESVAAAAARARLKIESKSLASSFSSAEVARSCPQPSSAVGAQPDSARAIAATGLRPQELCDLAWGLAKLQYHPGERFLSLLFTCFTQSSRILYSTGSIADSGSSSRSDGGGGRLQGRAQRDWAQNYANVLWAMARLRYCPPSAEMAACLQGLLAPATLNINHSSAEESQLSSSRSGHSSSSSTTTSTTITTGGVSRSYRIDISDSPQLQQQPHLKGVDVAHVLWALGVLRYKPSPIQLRLLLLHTHVALHATGQALGIVDEHGRNAATASASASAAAAGLQARLKRGGPGVAALKQRDLDGSSAAALAAATAAAARKRQPLQAVLSKMARARPQAGMSAFELVRALWGLQQLHGGAPLQPAMLDGVAAAALALTPSYHTLDAPSLMYLARGLARLGSARCPPACKEALASNMEERLATLNAHALAHIVGALARTQYRPSPARWARMCTRTGQLLCAARAGEPGSFSLPPVPLTARLASPATGTAATSAAATAATPWPPRRPLPVRRGKQLFACSMAGPREVVLLLWGLAQMGGGAAEVSVRWANLALLAARRAAPSLSREELRQLVWAVFRLRLKPYYRLRWRFERMCLYCMEELGQQDKPQHTTRQKSQRLPLAMTERQQYRIKHWLAAWRRQSVRARVPLSISIHMRGHVRMSTRARL